MPIYEYRCDACGAELEKLQKISDAPLRDCPACGKPALAKLVSASSFRLKGSGWYETDFKTGKKKNGAADSAGENSGSGSGGSAGDSAGESPAASPASTASASSADSTAPKSDSAGKPSGQAA
jgi:putative FmdB family regulatory protein